MLKLKSILSELKIFEELREKLSSSDEVLVKGINGSFLSFLLNFVYDNYEKNIIAILPDTEQAEKLADDLQSFMPTNRVYYFPQSEIIPFDKGNFTPALHSARLNTLISILEEPSSIIVTTPIGIMHKIAQPESVKKLVSYLKVGDEIERDFLIEWLIEYDFERMHSVEEIGQFSVRGGIIDVFSYEAEIPHRIELFDNAIESIREFDVLTQTSVNKVEKIRIVGKNGDDDISASLFEYLQETSIIYWGEFERINKLINEWLENSQKIKNENIGNSPDPPNVYLSYDEIKKQVSSFQQIKHVSFYQQKNNCIDFKVRNPRSFHGNIKLLCKYLNQKFPKKEKSSNLTYIVFDGIQRRERLKEFILAEIGWLPPIKFIEGDIHSGFLLSHPPLEILTEHEIFNRVKARKHRRRLRTSGSLIRQLNSLKYGDYVVHVDYGIGRYIGTKRIKVAGMEKDTIKIEYEDNDILYVNLDKLNFVQKYVSEEGYKPPLTKLGGSDWQRTKEKTKKSVENIARDLVQLYAKRMSGNGIVFSEDSVWQRELEESFIYVDTPDQARTSQEIKQDMERNKPMDRLVCGDVGFGKTEVAVRAAFKAVMDGKQAAFLVPTTILAQQHFHTIRERLKNFPVNIEVISRFRSQNEQKKIIERLKNGDVDIIIGTHRLISEDVEFKDLGLLIVDEEQQFGVKHKEKLRKIKENVDTLAFSATPIPRTLQMALMGARDLSNIDTPPRNRLPIITEICTWDKELIYRAITFEMSRNGQIFFVHNRVQTIYGIAELLKQIVPTAKIAIAHGQMRERDLEKIMLDFYNKKYDVLLATMIIENGLDIPNCNTIIINRADRFGLAQLYQLRGRVGRSDRQAYAYLIVPPNDRINDTSLKRLYTIEEFSDLGSGLKIAMRDLEIRGAGNLLGHQQSGYINAVGYDLYQKILRETVDKIQDDSLPEDLISEKKPVVDTSIDVDTDMFIPDNYIESSNEKVMIYHRMMNIDSTIHIDNLTKEIIDRFGPLPEQVKKLIEMVKIKRLASQRYIKQVQIVKNKMILTFENKVVEKNLFIDQELPRYINQKFAPISFNQSEGFKINVQLSGKNTLDYLIYAKNFLHNL